MTEMHGCGCNKHRGSEPQALAVLRQAEARQGLGPSGRFDPNQIPEFQAARQQLRSGQVRANLAETNARRYANLFETGDVARSAYDQARDKPAPRARKPTPRANNTKRR